MADNTSQHSSNENGNFSLIMEEYGKGETQLNKSFSLNSAKFFESKTSRKTKLWKRYFMCKECKSSPKIIFKDSYLLDINCDCKEISDIRTKKFIKKYSIHKKEDIGSLLNCHKHNQHKYECYCLDCERNLCEECLKETYLHDNHSISYFDTNIDSNEQLKTLTDLIGKKREKLDEGDIDIREKLHLFEALINSFVEFPSYNFFTNIKNAIDYLKKLNINEMKEKIKIYKDNELKAIKEKSFLITYINISRQNFNDLSIFKELNNLNKLKTLILNENYISKIDPLLECDFEELENFEIERNKLNYKSLENFDKMKFKKIQFINLFRNEIESIKIFDKIIKFKTLTKFHVGENKFKKEEMIEIIKNRNIEYYLDLDFIKNIGLTGNFTRQTVHFIFKLKLQKLQFLYLNRNNLSSLDFLEALECPNLISFWAIENHLISFNGLSKLKYKNNIKRINLKDNNIKNIDDEDLSNFISQFENLNLLVLANNRINWDTSNNSKLIKKINDKFKDLRFIFEITKDNKIYLKEDSYT